MNLTALLVGLVTSMALALPTRAFELKSGTATLQLPAPPKRIVTYDIGVLDTLHTLGIPVTGVPKARFDGYLESYATFPEAGTLFKPDYDALEHLNPDLIIAGRRAVPELANLKKIAPTLGVAPDPMNFMVSFRQHTLALAQAFGKEDQARTALAQIDNKLGAVQKANEGKTGAFLFVMRDTVIAQVPGDREGYAYELTGLKSVLPAKDPNAPATERPEPGSAEAKAAAQKREQELVAIAKAEPDWLIVFDRGAVNGGEKTAENTLAKHPTISQTRAWREGRVYYADPNGWYIITTGLNNMNSIADSLLAAMK